MKVNLTQKVSTFFLNYYIIFVFVLCFFKRDLQEFPNCLYKKHLNVTDVNVNLYMYVLCVFIG